jgi:hypothetical protein
MHGGRTLMQTSAVLSFLSALSVGSSIATANDDEITLFDARGKAVAYLALDHEMTVYLWSGKPVAYFTRDSAGGFHVHGFNGMHLGWFVGGIVRDHEGNAACAVKELLQQPELEPLKSLKQLKPLKSLTQLAPLRPLFTTSWGYVPCRFFLTEGSE